MLRPTSEFGVDAERLYLDSKRFKHPCNVGFAFVALSIEEQRDAFIEFRIEESEAEVFQFPFDLKHAQPVRERREQVFSLLRCQSPCGVICLGD